MLGKSDVSSILASSERNHPPSSWESFVIALFERNPKFSKINELPKEGQCLILAPKAKSAKATKKIHNDCKGLAVANLNNTGDFRCYPKYGTFIEIEELSKNQYPEAEKSKFKKIYLYKCNLADLISLYDRRLFITFDRLHLVDYKNEI